MLVRETSAFSKRANTISNLGQLHLLLPGEGVLGFRGTQRSQAPALHGVEEQSRSPPASCAQDLQSWSARGPCRRTRGVVASAVTCFVDLFRCFEIKHSSPIGYGVSHRG